MVIYIAVGLTYYPTLEEAKAGAQSWHELTGDAVDVVEWEISDATPAEDICRCLNHTVTWHRSMPLVFHIDASEG